MEMMLRPRQVAQKIGLSRSMLYLLIKRGEFPKPMRWTERAVVWRSSEVEAWLERRVEDRGAAVGSK